MNERSGASKQAPKPKKAIGVVGWVAISLFHAAMILITAVVLTGGIFLVYLMLSYVASDLARDFPSLNKGAAECFETVIETPLKYKATVLLGLCVTILSAWYFRRLERRHGLHTGKLNAVKSSGLGLAIFLLGICAALCLVREQDERWLAIPEFALLAALGIVGGIGAGGCWHAVSTLFLRIISPAQKVVHRMKFANEKSGTASTA